MNLAASALLAARLDALRAAVVSARCDALLVTRRPNLFYLTNFPGSAGAVLVTPADLFLILDSRYHTEGRDLCASAHGPAGATIVPVESSYDETMSRLLTVIAGTQARATATVVGFEAEDVSVARHAWLREHLPRGVVLEPTCGLAERLRERKDAHEIATLREAARRLSSIALTLGHEIAAGRTERDVAGAIDAAMRSSGFSRPAFDTIVASGANGALPHATAGNRAIRAGDLVVVDFGGVWDGYCVDMTRTIAVGAPDADARRVYEAVRAAQRAAIAAVRPGVTTGEVDAAARAVLEREGLGEAFGHATGHGLGIEVHEEPRVSRPRPGDRAAGGRAPGMVPIEPGMVFTIEPGAYLPGWGGVRIEDDVLVTADGCDVLTEPWGQALDEQVVQCP